MGVAVSDVLPEPLRGKITKVYRDPDGSVFLSIDDTWLIRFRTNRLPVVVTEIPASAVLQSETTIP